MPYLSMIVIISLILNLLVLLLVGVISVLIIRKAVGKSNRYSLITA
jgi:hypothetical protein